MRGFVSNGTRQLSPPIRGARRKASDWYFAELVHECRVQGRKTIHVWVNTHVLRASSPEKAYQKANAIGRKNDSTYRNDVGGKVTWRFRGLRELIPILESIEDGAEIMFESHTRLTERGVRKMVSAKHQLAAFRD